MLIMSTLMMCPCVLRHGRSYSWSVSRDWESRGASLTHPHCTSLLLFFLVPPSVGQLLPLSLHTVTLMCTHSELTSHTSLWWVTWMCLSENVAAGKIPKLLSWFFLKKSFLSFDYVYVYEFVHMSAVPVETSEGYLISWSWSYGWLWATQYSTWVLCKEQKVLLTIGPSPQPWVSTFWRDEMLGLLWLSLISGLFYSICTFHQKAFMWGFDIQKCEL